MDFQNSFNFKLSKNAELDQLRTHSVGGFGNSSAGGVIQ